MWRGRFPRSLARSQLSPVQGGAFQQAGWLRPGQAGVILIGAARPAHIAATFVDLAGRGYLRIEETAGAEPDWLITRVRPASRLLFGQGLLRYEKTLLRRVFRRADHIRLSELSRTSAAEIGKVYAQLSRILGARLSPAGPDMGGSSGQDQDDTRAILRAFRRFLQEFQPPADADPWTAIRRLLALCHRVSADARVGRAFRRTQAARQSGTGRISARPMQRGILEWIH
jgi:hypothetical protein